MDLNPFSPQAKTILAFHPKTEGALLLMWVPSLLGILIVLNPQKESYPLGKPSFADRVSVLWL